MNGNSKLAVGVPPKTIEQLSVEACMEDINTALKKYNCDLHFEQVHVNGVPIPPGRFRVVKNPPAQETH